MLFRSHILARTRTLACSVAHAPAPPALALTPPNLCVLEEVADPSALLRFWEPERVWLASEFPPGRRRGPGEHWGSPPHPGPALSSSRRGRANKGEQRLAAGHAALRRDCPSLPGDHGALPGEASPPSLVATHLTAETLGTRGREGGRTAHTSKSFHPGPRIASTGLRKFLQGLWLLAAVWFPSVTLSIRPQCWEIGDNSL